MPFHLIRAAALLGLGAYELWHYYHYGNFGFGNPYKKGLGYERYGTPYSYGAPREYGGGYGSYY
jgi:hypothetical protein